MRRADWEVRLGELVAAWQSLPFAWGERDCAQFALAVLRAVSSRDWSQVSVQPYRSARGAQALLRRLEVADMVALAEKMLGPALPAAYARRGDLVACASPHGPALGVCLGGQLALPGAGGLVFRPFTDAFFCWRL